MTLHLRWDNGWIWTCGRESGIVPARFPLDALPDLIELARRLAFNVEVKGLIAPVCEAVRAAVISGMEDAR
jgi:hypothetical protein